MSWEIRRNEAADLVMLEGDLCMQGVAEFHRAVLPLAGAERAVQIDASAVRSIHTAILQVLHALSRAVGELRVTGASEAFRAAEVRVGLSFERSDGERASATGNGKQH